MGGNPVVGGLMDKRAEIVGVIKDLERQAANWRTAVAGIDATLKLFAPKIDPDQDTRPKPVRRSRIHLFKFGEMPALIRDVYRAEPTRALTAIEITDRIVALKGLDADNPAAYQSVSGVVQRTLHKRFGGELERTVSAKGEIVWRRLPRVVVANDSDDDQL